MAAWSQTLPDAGSLQQQAEREQQGLVPRLPTKPPEKGLPEAPLLGKTVVVQSFKFQGNTLLSSAELSEALAPLMGRPLDFSRLQSSAVMVADLYREKGWVVQTFLPEQDIANGQVTISVVEAVFGHTVITGTPTTRVPAETVLAVLERQLPAGRFLNMNALDRALLLADDLPGVTVSGTLGAGQQSGETDLILRLSDELLLTGSVSADNTGAVSTRADRASLALALNSPLGIADALSLNATDSQGSHYGHVAYSIPLGPDGWRLGINSSRLDYTLVSEDYASLHASGNSSTLGLELSYPLVRSRAFNLSGSLEIERKEYFNASGGATSSAYTNRPVSLGLSGSRSDSLGGGGANAFSWVLTAGQLNLNGSPTQGSDASTTQTDGLFSKIRYSLSRQQSISSGVSAYAAFSGQWANKNLDSSEKFYLGGSNGVRAYPNSEGGGSQGQMLNLELRWQLPNGFNLVGFYDYGQVMQNAMNDFAGASALNSYALKGAGMSLVWRHGSGLSMQLSYAKRIGDNPNPITTEANRGADQDGTLLRDRLWFTASKVF